MSFNRLAAYIATNGATDPSLADCRVGIWYYEPGEGVVCIDDSLSIADLRALADHMEQQIKNKAKT